MNTKRSGSFAGKFSNLTITVSILVSSCFNGPKRLLVFGYMDDSRLPSDFH